VRFGEHEKRKLQKECGWVTGVKNGRVRVKERKGRERETKRSVKGADKRERNESGEREIKG
jgi:hypothetical protein